MKKTLVSALTTALVVGAASTTFAAANPFSDVPMDSWAYDAVTQLAADGIVTGYPDGTFQGEQNMTRYEMAQIVAKALAYSGNMNPADKAMIDKLAAEFGDELANLGVRVANLEKKVDNVKWDGYARYDYIDTYKEASTPGHSRDNRLVLRLNLHAQVNDMWTVNSRIETEGLSADEGTDSLSNTGSEIHVAVINATAKVGTTDITLGRFDSYDDVTDGMVSDHRISGAEVKFNGKQGWALKLSAGREALNQTQPDYTTKGAQTYDFFGAEVTKMGPKWDFGVGYHAYLGNDTLARDYDADDDQITSIGASAKYKFGKAFVRADYNHGMSLDDTASANAYLFTLGYAPTKKLDFSVQYANLPRWSKVSQTYDWAISNTDQKGWAFNAKWKMQKNVSLTLKYFLGKDDRLNSNDDIQKFFSRLEFAF